MQEIQSEQKSSIDELLEEKNMNTIIRKRSNESLWGTLLLAFMLLFVAASMVGIGWVVYSEWKNERAAESRLSISGLQGQSGEENKNTAQAEISQAPVEEKAASTDSNNIAAAKKVEVSVLNGGVAKGGAGILADFLKKEGYLKTDLGNTLKDYTGVTIYYEAALAKEAEVIKESVIKKYPQAKLLPADPKNKETSASQVTIILGK